MDWRSQSKPQHENLEDSLHNLHFLHMTHFNEEMKILKLAFIRPVLNSVLQSITDDKGNITSGWWQVGATGAPAWPTAWTAGNRNPCCQHQVRGIFPICQIKHSRTLHVRSATRVRRTTLLALASCPLRTVERTPRHTSRGYVCQMWGGKRWRMLSIMDHRSKLSEVKTGQLCF